VRSEDQGNAALYDDVSHGKTHLAVQIDVENGQIEQPCLSQRGSAADIPGLGGDRMAKFFDHVGDHHPDHDLVLDEQHTERHVGGLESLAERSYAVFVDQASIIRGRGFDAYRKGPPSWRPAAPVTACSTTLVSHLLGRLGALGLLCCGRLPLLLPLSILR
jgi:hypothetical protein